MENHCIVHIQPIPVLEGYEEDYPVTLKRLSGQILDRMTELHKAFFVHQEGINDVLLRIDEEVRWGEGDEDVRRYLRILAERVAREIAHRVEVRPHWYVMGCLSEATHTNSFQIRPPTLWEKANNQMQHGLDNLQEVLAEELFHRMDTPEKARELFTA